jgi:hypothetical protein
MRWQEMCLATAPLTCTASAAGALLTPDYGVWACCCLVFMYVNFYIPARIRMDIDLTGVIWN